MRHRYYDGYGDGHSSNADEYHAYAHTDHSAHLHDTNRDTQPLHHDHGFDLDNEHNSMLIGCLLVRRLVCLCPVFRLGERCCLIRRQLRMRGSNRAVVALSRTRTSKLISHIAAEVRRICTCCRVWVGRLVTLDSLDLFISVLLFCIRAPSPMDLST